MGKAVGIRRELEHTLTRMESKLRELEKEMVADGTKRQELEECKSEYTALIEKLRCHNHHLYITHTHSEEGKAGKLLAQMVQREQRGEPITKITLENGVMGYSQAEINGAFMDYYRELYEAPRQWNEDDYEEYLNDIELQQLDAEEGTELGGPITPEEVGEVIKGLANGKTPGGDGFPSEFYKQYKRVLIP